MQNNNMANSDSPIASARSRRGGAAFAVALLLSLLLHLALFFWLPAWRAYEPPAMAGPELLRLSLWEPIAELEEPEPEQAVAEATPESPPEELHLPRHTAEQIDLDGTDFDAPESDQLARAETDDALLPDTPADAGAAEAPEIAVEEQETPSDREGELRFAAEPDMPDPGVAGMQPLDEVGMGAAMVADPRSEVEARRIEMVNRYLARMTEQVREHWIMPPDATDQHRGVIRMRVDERGFLVSANLHLPSGHRDLDQSVLAAIHAVDRYQVPDSPEIVRRYYSNLRFEYSGR